CSSALSVYRPLVFW
nr:immunoglobulin heavy chain junction region [Macaca mulatta]MOW99752.1 immunoglobulin heavy chain junction region [Macaca mulatta]MOX00079.1 immunoglobulin heavy chain junction region [Macaca mulatta]MOX00243.1 immunoglobulin heavy chain junction region [Macaca mulatta]MOX03125.1 immunoglobulin heavy chain junction region [Macaca mulatta]